MNGSLSMSPTVPPISETNDIGVRLARDDAIEALFNSVGHMRNNLHGATQEIAATLTRAMRL